VASLKAIMDEVRDLYPLQEGKATLREYVILARNRHRFEAKSRGRVLYAGESYKEARALYQQLSER
jgi:hypothetical protein